MPCLLFRIPHLLKGVLTLLFIVAVSASTKAQSSASADRPNFIFIVVDDLNDYTGYMGGNPQTNTPRINRLSDDGVSFSNAYCNSPVCAPSRTSFMTGRAPEYTQIFSNYTYTQEGNFRRLFDPSKTIYTMPEWLKDSADYFTYGLGKVYHGWQGGGKYNNDYQDSVMDPCNRELSWSYFNDYHPNEGPDPIAPEESYHQGVKTFKLGSLDNDQEVDMEDYKLVNEAITFIDDYADNPSNYCDRPFFLSVGIHKPHYLLYAPERYFPEWYTPDLNELPYDIPYNVPANAYPANGAIPTPLAPTAYSDFDNLSSFAQNLAVGIDKHFYFEAWPLFADPFPIIDPALDSLERLRIISDSKRSIAQQAYMACVYFADYQINRMLSALEAHPELSDNTIIILTADNSFSLGEKKHWGKSALWDTDMRVPLIIYDPRNPKGQICDAPVSLIDIFPTVMDYADIDPPVMPDSSRYLDGQSLMPFLDNPTLNWTKPTVSSVGFGAETPEGFCHTHYTVMDGEFHYIRYRMDVAANCPDTAVYEEELYELGKTRGVDPEEWYNLADDPAYASIKDYLESWIPTDSTNVAYEPPMPSATILHDTLPCSWTTGDTLNLSVNWIDGFGQPLATGPLGYRIEWEVEGDSSIHPSPNLSIVPTATGSDSALTITMFVTNPTGRRVDFDRMTVLMNGGGPSPAFTASLTDSSALVLTPDIVTGNQWRATWNLGDGTLLNTKQPAPYVYRKSDTVTITHTVYHMQEELAQCSWSADTTLILHDSLFSSTVCIRPLPPEVQDVSSSKFLLGWSEVQNATSYEVRYRREDPFFVNWFQRPTLTNPQLIPLASPKREWEVQVKAVCGSEESEWSSSTYFRNPDCQAPDTPSITLLTIDSVHLSFGSSNFASLGYDALLRPIGAPKIYQILPPTATSVGFGDLIPGLNYQFYMRSRCPGIGGAVDPSKIVWRFFTAPTAKSAFEQMDIAPGITVQPNPARDFAQINFTDWQDEEDRILALQDLQGRVLGEYAIAAGTTSIQIRLDDLLPGMYFLQFAGEPASSTRLVVIE